VRVCVVYILGLRFVGACFAVGLDFYTVICVCVCGKRRDGQGIQVAQVQLSVLGGKEFECDRNHNMVCVVCVVCVCVCQEEYPHV
jgi:hypothetical protein